MFIYLIRHGQKVAVPGNPALTALGRTQAKASGIYLAKQNIAKVIASPLKRTQETAQLICYQLQLPFSTDERLTERANWTADTPIEAFIEYWHHSSRDRDWSSSIGNSSRATGKKVDEIINECKQSGIDSLLLVTHGGTITDFLRNHFSDEKLISDFFETEKQLIETAIPECAITLVEFDGTQFALHSIASTDHYLPDLN
jgi:broad specificity phosphatase PhoE